MPEKEKYNELMDNAWKEFNNDNYEDCERICNVLISESPDSSNGYYLLGHINWKRKNHEQALHFFSIALNKAAEDKQKAFIHYWIAELYGDYAWSSDVKNPNYDKEKSKIHYKKAREYGDYPKDVVYKLRHSYKKDSETINLFEEGINKFPDEISFYICLSKVYAKQNNFEMALKIANNAIDKGFESVSLYYYIGQLYFENQQFSTAREFLFKALQMNIDGENNYILHYAIGNSFFKENDFVNAESHYQQSYNESKEKDFRWFGFCGLIHIYCLRNDVKAMQKLINDFCIDKNDFFDSELYEPFPIWFDIEEFVDITPIHEIKTIFPLYKKIKFSTTDDWFLFNHWLIRTKFTRYLGRHSESLTALKNALTYSFKDNCDFIYKELSYIYSDLIDQKSDKNQDISSVLTSFITDIKKFPAFKEQATRNLRYLVKTLFELKDYDNVEKLYQLFEIPHITKKEIWFEIAYSLNEMNQKEDAKQAYLLHIKEEGESSASLNNLGLIYEHENDYDKAIELFEKTISLDSNNSKAKNNLARVKEKSEKQEKEASQRKILDFTFKSALKSLKSENNFVIDKLSKFIFNLKQEDGFNDWEIAIQQYKFPKLMEETDKQKAESLRNQWIKKGYIKDTDCRNEYNVITYLINPYIESEITKINNNKIPENWIVGYTNITIDKLEETGYFELKEHIQKIEGTKFKLLIERDLNELVFNYLIQNQKATIVLSGSLIELSLIYYFDTKGISQVSYTTSKGKTITKQLYDCVLYDLISYAEKSALFGFDFHSLSNLSRIYRNFIHPGKELKDELNKSKCDLCFISAMEILKKILL